jgi:hypothetical protein
MFWSLIIGIWILFGIWILKFGISESGALSINVVVIERRKKR